MRLHAIALITLALLSTGGVKMRHESLSVLDWLVGDWSCNPLPVAFRLTDCGDGAATFENPDHDFPTKIAYRLESPGELTVTVSNEERGFTLEFIRAE